MSDRGPTPSSTEPSPIRQHPLAYSSPRPARTHPAPVPRWARRWCRPLFPQVRVLMPIWARRLPV
ncbi:hypothetical protein Ae406Ps2_6496 [Pseudonocardia sp. Ae406_Ps2]|nr:hypothetical protein Ae406Ps2_6496 [Pseudonocardia sp. Ae406_Ps2]